MEKIDQYVTIDTAFASSGPLEKLHTRLYGSGGQHPGRCFYAFACRTALGCAVHSQDGKTALDGSGPVFANFDERKLAAIPGTTPPEHYHALCVELGGKIHRFREFLVFHSDRVLPEFLVVFHRTHGGSVAP